MLLAIHELEAARMVMLGDELPTAFKMLARASRIFEQLNNAWDVLRTMTLSEYTVFRPSLYQVAISWLCTRFEHAPLEGEPGRSDWQADTQVQDLRLRVYEEPNAHWELYELAEKLVDLEDYFRRGCFNHVTTVERIIGFKRGTGGTAGVSNLRKMLDVELFPELWNVRGAL